MAEGERPTPQIVDLAEARKERRVEQMREILQGYDALLKTIDQMGGLLAREPKMHRLVGQASIDAGRMLALTLDAAGIPRDEWNEFAQKHTTGRL